MSKEAGAFLRAPYDLKPGKGPSIPKVDSKFPKLRWGPKNDLRLDFHIDEKGKHYQISVKSGKPKHWVKFKDPHHWFPGDEIPDWLEDWLDNEL